MPPSPGIRVVRSPIHGYGIVATRAFRAEETLFAVDGILGPAGAFDDRYSVWLDGDSFFHVTDQTRWLNHSCDPNVWIDGDVRDGLGWANVVALRDLAPGEELTSDYAYPIELAERCSCGTANCSGWIVDAKDRQKVG